MIFFSYVKIVAFASNKAENLSIASIRLGKLLNFDLGGDLNSIALLHFVSSDNGVASLLYFSPLFSSSFLWMFPNLSLIHDESS